MQAGWVLLSTVLPAETAREQHSLPELDRSSPDHNKTDYFTSAQSAMLRAGASGR